MTTGKASVQRAHRLAEVLTGILNREDPAATLGALSATLGAFIIANAASPDHADRLAQNIAAEIVAAVAADDAEKRKLAEAGHVR